MHATPTVCPSCSQPLVVDGVSRRGIPRDFGPMPGSTSEAATRPASQGPLFFHEGRCPYPSCGAPVIACTADGIGGPIVLLSTAEVRRMRARWALENVVPLVLAWAMTFGVVALAMWAAMNGIVEAESAAAVAVVFGGPALVVVSICGFVALTVICSDASSSPRGHLDWDLRLRPVPHTYRG